MGRIDFTEREMTDAEFARMNEGFDEHAHEHGNPTEVGERFGFVALDGETFIGCSSGLAYKHGPGYGKWCHLTDLFVEKPYRKQGVGAQLLAKLEERFHTLGVDNIYTWTAGYEAPEFYKKQGYQIFAEMEGWYHSGHARVGLQKRFAAPQNLTVDMFRVEPLSPTDGEWVAQVMIEQWGEDKAIVHNTSYQPSTLSGFVVVAGTKRRGLLTYHIADNQCEIVTIDSFQPGQGIGTALIQAVKSMAQEAGLRRLWLITTNDNLNALRFYQKRGFSLVKITRNALDASRRLKPSIPSVGLDQIPLRDEIELELDL